MVLGLVPNQCGWPITVGMQAACCTVDIAINWWQPSKGTPAEFHDTT